MGGGRWGVDVPGLLSAPPGPGGKLRHRDKSDLLLPLGQKLGCPALPGAPTCESPEVCGSQNPGGTYLGARWRWEVPGKTAAPPLHSWALEAREFYVTGQAPVEISFVLLGPKRGGGGLGHRRTARNNTAAPEHGALRPALAGGIAAKVPLSWCFMVAMEDQFR